MGREYNAHERQEMRTKFWSESTKRKTVRKVWVQMKGKC